MFGAERTEQRPGAGALPIFNEVFPASDLFYKTE
jgi:hypothetical protein